MHAGENISMKISENRFENFLKFSENFSEFHVEF